MRRFINSTLVSLAAAQAFSSAWAQEATATAPTAIPAQPTATDSIGLRLDCLHDFNRDKGSTQSCLTITGLRINLTHRMNPATIAHVRLDPFATPVGGRSDTPDREGLPGPEDTELGIVDDYGVTWTPRPNLEIAAGTYDGATKIPAASGLSLANSFALTGWKQTALTVRYNLQALPDMHVTFAVGNGEGEDGRNLDPQQYFGFEAGASPVKGVAISLGVSMDGNSTGSAETSFARERYKSDCGIDLTGASDKLGYSTQRLAAGVALDGTLSGVENLKAALGWQRTVMSDLDKGRRSAPTAEDLDGATPGCRFDTDAPFVESSDPSAVNTVQMTTYGVSLSYRILASYFVGLDYTTRNIDTGSADVFRTCDTYDGGVCTVASTTGSNKLSQTAMTVGAGMDLAADLRLTFEYHESSYDNEYALAYYAAPDGKTSDTRELFNFRVAYNWQ